MKIKVWDKRYIKLRDIEKGKLAISMPDKDGHYNAFVKVYVYKAVGGEDWQIVKLDNIGTQYPDGVDLNTPVRYLVDNETLMINN
jgi:hypothetical protein